MYNVCAMSMQIDNQNIIVKQVPITKTIEIYSSNPGDITFDVKKNGNPTTGLIINSVSITGYPKLVSIDKRNGYRYGTYTYITGPMPELLMGRTEDMVDGHKLFTTAFRGKITSYLLNFTYLPWYAVHKYDAIGCNFMVTTQDVVLKTITLRYRSLTNRDCISSTTFTDWNEWNDFVFIVDYDKNANTGTFKTYRNGTKVGDVTLDSTWEPGYINSILRTYTGLQFYLVSAKTSMYDIYISTQNIWDEADVFKFSNKDQIPQEKYKYHYPLINYTNSKNFVAYEEKGNGLPLLMHDPDEIVSHEPMPGGSLDFYSEIVNTQMTINEAGVYTVTARNRLQQVPDYASDSEKYETTTFTVTVENESPTIVKAGPRQIYRMYTP